MITLFPHQDLKFHEIRHHIDNGETDILFSSPMGSGKTRTLQYLIEDLKSSRMFNKYLVIVPLVSIKQSWLRLANIFSISNDLEFQYTSRSINNTIDLKDKSFWEDFTDETFIISRNAIASKDIITWLETEKPDCSKIFIICDEGHHHADVNVSGELCKILWKLGATIVRTTGTPWHNQTELKTKNTKTVNLSFAEYSRQKDPKTNEPLAPLNWESRKFLVPFETDDLSFAYGSELGKKIKLPDAFKKACIISLKDQWLSDGCPKVIINIPRVEWAQDLLNFFNASKEIEKFLGRSVNIANFTGNVSAKRKKQISDVLTSESEVREFNDSKIDIIISCARMDEGTDWSLCSHIYNVRMPDSVIKILQRWTRASRNKNHVNNYPNKWKNTQSITFFLPLLSDGVKEIFWKDHKNTALVLACFMENHDQAQKWCNSNTALDRFTDQLKKKSETARSICQSATPTFKNSDGGVNPGNLSSNFSEIVNDSISETYNDDVIGGSILEQAETLSEIIQILSLQKDLSLKNISKIVGEKVGDKKSKKYQELLSKLMDLIKSEHSEVDKLIKDKKNEILQNSNRKEPVLIRCELIELFEKIAHDFDIEIKIPDLNIKICSFTAYDAETIHQKMQENWKCLPIFSEQLIYSEAEKYKKQFGEFPRYRAGSWVGFGGMAWSGAQLWLKQHKEISLAKFLGMRTCRSYKEMREILIDFKDREKRWPKAKEKDLFSLMNYFRKKYPEEADKLEIPKINKHRPEDDIKLIQQYYKDNGSYPIASKDMRENNKEILNAFIRLKQRHSDLLIRHNIPLTTEGNRADPIILGKLVNEFTINSIKFGNIKYRNWDSTIFDIKWSVINSYFHRIVSNPTYSRALSEQPDICQLTSMTKLISEIQNNCWKFKEKSSDRYVYYSEIKRDEIEIDPTALAVRTHYLDWASSDSNIPDKKKFDLKAASN